MPSSACPSRRSPARSAPIAALTLTLALATARAALGAQGGTASAPAADTAAWRPSIVDARETPPVARAIINETLSPFCPGLILAACPSPQADSLRKAIVRRAADGESRERIEADLYRQFGDEIRAAPSASGFGLVAWLAPALLLLVGGAGLTLWLRSARGGDGSAPSARRPLTDDAALAATVGASPEELARLDALLRRDDR
jgi:cytochrome c-type biogenesis protein CcmH/NrfF